ncbi:ribbon-helix-helix domain-containing protein [Streptomyces sp. NPDC050560]|uniref:ribbon-helix-helix domain-containing protein n=1 Tax=Streptomyces sp. NPDC050560 TaxID=3365630 RepID=UPI0037B91D1F
MKISVSLSQEDVEFVDAYGKGSGARSRSAVIHAAIQMLREARLEDDYAAAWDEWYAGDDAALWDTTTSDGLSGEGEERAGS